MLRPENAAPKFGIQDREIDGDDAAPEQRHAERGRGYDKLVADFDATDNVDLLTFEVGGADGGLFSLSAPDW